MLIADGSFFIISFAEYVDSQGDFSQSFSSWLKVSCFNRLIVAKLALTLG